MVASRHDPLGAFPARGSMATLDPKYASLMLRGGRQRVARVGKKRSVAVMTCHSGGMIDNMNTTGNKTVTLTSSTCAQSSYDAGATCDGILHAEFNYTLPNALRLKNP